jgi:hypothetical protein
MQFIWIGRGQRFKLSDGKNSGMLLLFVTIQEFHGAPGYFLYLSLGIRLDYTP